MQIWGHKMIRDYKKSDVDEIIRIYTLEYKAMPEEIETLRTASKILVYEEEGIKGFIHLIISGSYCYAEMGAASNELIMPIGLKLWSAAEKIFEEKAVKSVEIFHVKDNLEWEQLFDEIGFKYWYSVFRLSYEGEKIPESKIRVIKYEDDFFEEKIRLESEAFSVLRKENHIEPYNWYLNASKEALEAARVDTLGNKEYIYLFFENEDMVGASMVKNAEVELLFVNVKYQKKGYGKQILEFSINKGLEQNSTSVNLNALASNEKALNLYKNAGFKVVQAQDARKLVIK